MPTYADHVDYSGYEARHVGLERLDAAPSDVFPGRFYFDDTIGSLGVYNGSSWSYPNVPITEFDDLTVNGTLTVGNINTSNDIISSKSGLMSFGMSNAAGRAVYGMFDGSTIKGSFYQAFGNTSGGSGTTPSGGAEFVIDASLAATKFNILAYNGSAFPIIFSARSDGSIVIPALGGSGDRVVFTDNAGVLTAGSITSPTPGGPENSIQISKDGVFTGYDTFMYHDDGADFQNLVVGKSGSARGITVYGSIFTMPGYGNFVAAAGQGTFYGSMLTNAGYVNGPITIAPLQELIVNASGIENLAIFNSIGLSLLGKQQITNSSSTEIDFITLIPSDTGGSVHSNIIFKSFYTNLANTNNIAGKIWFQNDTTGARFNVSIATPHATNLDNFYIDGYSGIVRFPSGIQIMTTTGTGNSSFNAGWISMPIDSTYYSGIGHGDVGSNPWWARAAQDGSFMTGTTAGDLVSLNAAGKIMFSAANSGVPTLVLSGVNVGIGVNAPTFPLHIVTGSNSMTFGSGTLTIKQGGLSNGLVLQSASAGDPYSPLIIFKDTLFNISAQIAMFYGGDLVLQSQFNTHIKFGTDNSFFNVAITAYPYDVGSGGYSMLVKSPIANGVALMVRAFTSQTANILEIQQVDTTVLSGFDKDGAVFATTALQMHASTYIGVKGSGVRIGADSYTTAPVSSAILELVSTTKGFVPTRHTTAQRLAMTPEESMLVYDLDLKGWFGYDGTDWVQL